MCGRFTLRADRESWREYLASLGFDEISDVGLRPRFNVAPTQEVLAVVRPPDAEALELCELRWGLVPHWAKDEKIAYRTINARSETAFETPAFRDAARRRRCLIPADGFYEWRSEGRARQPYLVHLVGRPVFSLAGLHERWQGPSGPVRTCTILTCPANDLLAPLHDRMPVILDADAYATWLDPHTDAKEVLSGLLRPYPAERMACHRVPTVVNKPGNDVPECVRPAGPVHDTAHPLDGPRPQGELPFPE